MQDDEILKLDFSGWPLPNEFLIELGRISALWTSLEKLLMVLIGKLSGYNKLEDARPFILLTHSSFPQKLDILGTLCESLVLSHPHLGNYKDVISRLRSAQNLRNKYLHNSLSFDKKINKAHIGIGHARGSLKVTVEQIDVADLRRAAIEIDEASAALYKLVLEKDHGPAWKRRSKKI